MHPQPVSTTQTVTARSSAARVEASQNRVLWGIVCAVLVLIGVAILAVRTDSLNLLLVMVVALTIFALMVIKSARRPDMYCPHCGTIGTPSLRRKGSGAMQIVLLLFFVVPGILYWMWRQTARPEVCPTCRQPGLIPADSPRAVEMRRGR